MENNSNNNRTSTNINSSASSSTTTTAAAAATNPSTTTLNSTSMVSSSVPSSASSTSTIRQSHKRTFAESDSSSRTERHLCSFSHLWIINYLSSYVEDSNFTCLQSETFSPVNTPYSNTRWSLKLYPRGLNEKQHTNNSIAIFLKYVSGSMPTIKAKAEFSVVSRNNELVMLRSTNFHTFSSGNDWGYSEFLDGNYLNTRRNDLLTDDRLRVYVRVILVDEKETTAGDLFNSSHQYHHHHHHHNHHHHHHHHPSPQILPPPLPPHPTQQQMSTIPKSQASTSSSSASSSSLTTPTTTPSNSNTSNVSSTTPTVGFGLFNNEKECCKSLELLSNQIKSLLDGERFTDVRIHVIPKQKQCPNDEQRKSNRLKRSFSKQQQQQQHPSCSSCHCTSEKIKSILTNSERIFHHHHEQSSSVTSKESESTNDSRSSSTRRATRSTTSLLSRMAQSSSETNHSSFNYSTTTLESSSSDNCSSSSTLSKRCLCICHNQDNNDLDVTYDIQQSHMKYSNITPLATFHAHKAILVARSSSFASQLRLNNLNGTMHNLKSPPIDLYIDDLEPSTVRIMLIYIYTGRLPTSNDEVNNNLNPIDLFRAAVKHDLNELRELAKSAMIDVLKIENAIEMLEVSDQANDAMLKQQILTFIRLNASAVSKTTNWLIFTKNNPNLIIDAFRSLVSPTITNTTITKHNNNNNNNNNNLNHYHHTTSLTTASKYSKYD